MAKLIEYVNYLTKTYPQGAPRDAVVPLVLMVAPVAPHIAEEIWSRLGNVDSLAYQPFPSFDRRWLVDDSIELPVQVNGKVRGRINVSVNATNDDVVAAALADENVAGHVAGKTLVKHIVVPGRMVNLVVK